jgi:integrase/recombinase XerD
MRGRGFVRGTAWSRLAVARDWLGYTGGALDVDYRTVEAWAAGRGLTPSSTRNLLVNLRAFYRWCQREGLTVGDPTTLADRPTLPRRLPRPAPDRDIAAVHRTAGTQLAALVALMACAGLRCCECSRLDWADVDLVAATVIVNGKGSRERLIDVSADVVRALAGHALARPGRRVGAVFTGPHGARMSAAAVSMYVAKAFRATGSTVRAHQLRHRCATAALAHCGDLLAVRDLLGHASVSTTQIYTAAIPGRTAAASRALTLPAA